MAKGPDVVIVARHGARLDAADKQWHLTSPTPYDPPLTYGGWSQGKALGLRIASLLHARELEKAKDTSNGPEPGTACVSSGASKSANGASSGTMKRKHKIIIHSSPFLRCVQTSTAIAAGISQFRPPKDEPPPSAPTLKVPHHSKEKSPLGKDPSTSPAVQTVSGRRAEKSEPDSPPKPRKSGWLRLNNPAVNTKPYIGPEKILLRIDAFLGEWLSPDYYEDITPPPNSTMMVAGAKADLLRRSDYVEAPPNKPTSVGHFPGGWVRSNVASTASNRTNPGEGTFPSMGSLARALPRERSNSQGAMLSRQRSRSEDPHAPAELTVTHEPNGRLYDAPVPSYAVSPAEPIPRGYATHARDACLKVDFQWDSMREPQQWGDGGEFGDEWSTMHKRFRRGLAGMMQWYREHGTKTLPPQNMFPGFTFSERTTSAPQKAEPTPLMLKQNEKEKGEEGDDDEELVLVLVTHGAGCNALIGAITNQPVLMDISLAALSMAVRREVPRTTSSNNIYARRSSVVDPGMADTYEMKLLASIDHLRPGVDPSKPPRSQTPTAAASPTIGLDYRPPRRTGTGTSGTSTSTSQLDSLALGPSARSGWNSSLGSIRRTSTSGSGSFMTSNTPSGSVSPSTPSGSGLWGGSLRSISLNDTQADGRASPGAEMVEAFQRSQPRQTPRPPPPTSTPNVDGAASPEAAAENAHEEIEKHDDVAPLSIPKRTPSAASKPSGAAAGGLWGAPKKQESGNGLWKNSSVMWGPPKLDEVYEHIAGPKRRWTMTERE
ncbi:uncharacterized protein CC84DRAFT_1254376 [Paraphaeosphaeria sporulosa]|uniref:Phosphoglycerate mutase-like protein n=1 Tax=Paraphaeosphaeria sporulosa TaxID=1460663 RepID=A0A177CYR5_9PLEO|nr:uncharacterized protein CC84DRAFT_1254376 [Paraphaeosphaeria sporulosa]OAG12027.1 hypothetical protein CC84DRAFT_1254376 [Paraphaeosphaeria sporulosa]